MDYLQLSFPITRTEFNIIEALLERVGAISISSTDAGDLPILEPKPGETPLWQNLILTALFPANKNRRKVETQFKLLWEPSRLSTLVWQVLPEQDWERAWLTDYSPLQFGRNLWIGPQAFTPPPTVKASLFLDPGLAFGTGTHPTTSLCLQWLSEQNLEGKTILDFGCGSGILGLAALKLGALHVTGVDIDPQALQASHENALRNQIASQTCQWISVSTLSQGNPLTADILIANILANPLIELRNLLLSHLKPNGNLILSGILETQAEAVQTAYGSSIKWSEPKTLEGWVVLRGEKTNATLTEMKNAL